MYVKLASVDVVCLYVPDLSDEFGTNLLTWLGLYTSFKSNEFCQCCISLYNLLPVSYDCFWSHLCFVESCDLCLFCSIVYAPVVSPEWNFKYHMVKEGKSGNWATQSSPSAYCMQVV